MLRDLLAEVESIGDDPTRALAEVVLWTGAGDGSRAQAAARLAVRLHPRAAVVGTASRETWASRISRAKRRAAAWAAAKVISGDDYRVLVDALAQRGPLSPHHEAHVIARSIRDAATRSGAWTAVLSAPPNEVGRMEDDAMAAVESIEAAGDQGKALAALAPFLSEKNVRHGLEIARKREAVETLEEAMPGLAPRLAELGFPIEAAPRKPARSPTRGPGAASRRRHRAAAAAERSCDMVIAEALDAALRITPELSLFGARNDRAAALRNLAPGLAEQPVEVLAPPWTRALHVLAQPRPQGPDRGGPARPRLVILAAGGTRALREAALAVGDVGRWFP